MSAKVLVISGDRQYKINRSRAQRKVDYGWFRWNGRFEIVAVESSHKPIAALLIRPYTSGPPASPTDWAPRPSSVYMVMQLRTHGRSTES